MSLFKLFKKRLTFQIISMVLEEKACHILVKRIKNDEVIASEKKSFEIPNKESLTLEIRNYLNILQNDHEQTYLALFLNTLGQGAIPGCDNKQFDKFGVDENSIKTVCVDDSFTVYASHIDVNWVDKVFEKVGLDFVFSPFLMLNRFLAEEKNEDAVKLYLLHTNNGLTMMIFEGKKFLYGAFYNLAKEENLLYEDYDGVGSTGDGHIEEDIFEEFELDDDADINGIDSIDDDGSFESLMDYDEHPERSSSLDEKDMRFIKYIDASLKEFYHSDLYENSFITKVKIYDDAGLHDEVIKYLENELFLDTSAENINLLDTVNVVALEEALNHA